MAFGVSKPAACEARGVFFIEAMSRCLDTQHSHVLVVQKRVEQTDCVRPTANRSDQQSYQAGLAGTVLALHMQPFTGFEREPDVGE